MYTPHVELERETEGEVQRGGTKLYYVVGCTHPTKLDRP